MTSNTPPSSKLGAELPPANKRRRRRPDARLHRLHVHARSNLQARQVGAEVVVCHLDDGDQLVVPTDGALRLAAALLTAVSDPNDVRTAATDSG